MADDKKPIIIKKVIEEGHHGHHGGAWKVAYADFVTAMMAFFLLMWILNASEEETLKGIADYFTPTIATVDGYGGDGPLDGSTIGPEGTLNSSNSPMSTVAIPQFGPTDPTNQSGEARTVVEYEDRPLDEIDAEALEKSLEAATKAKDEKAFSALEDQIVQAMNKNPDLKPLVPNVIFEKTEEGLRIQIIDQEGRSMFESGSYAVEGETRDLLKLVGGSLARLPNSIIIAGHTDAVPYANQGQETGYGNWELSADRANATRRIFINSGITADRISRVSGLADTDPLKADDPRHPSNRRISVTLSYVKAPSAAEIEAVKDAVGPIEEMAPEIRESTPEPTPEKPQDAEAKPEPHAHPEESVVIQNDDIPSTISIDDLRNEIEQGH